MPHALQESSRPIGPVRRKRRIRFSFSLRMMFVVITVFGVWLGWNANIVRERQELLEVLARTHTAEGHELNHSTLERGWYKPDDPSRYEFHRVSLVRRLLGDESFVSVMIPHDVAPHLIERIEDAFPEARLYVWNLKHGLQGMKACRDSLYAPASERSRNFGKIFKTGIVD